MEPSGKSPPTDPGSGRLRRSWPARVAAGALVAATPVATWWVIGENPGNEIGGDPKLHPEDYDFLIHPPALTPTVELVLGITSALVVIVSMTVLIRARNTQRFDRRWWPPLLALVAAGAIVGLGARIVTAAVIGAYIGGGFMILFGTPTVIGLIVGSALRSIQVLRITTGRS